MNGKEIYHHTDHVFGDRLDKLQSLAACFKRAGGRPGALVRVGCERAVRLQNSVLFRFPFHWLF